MEKNSTFCHNVEGIEGYHTKWTKSESKGQIPADLTHMPNMKKQRNKSISRETNPKM